MHSTAKLLAAFALFTIALVADDTPSVVSRVRPQAEPRDVMTNEGLVVLSEAGFSDSFIVEKILLSGTRFDVSEEGLAFLRRSGISDQLTLFVLERTARPTMFPTDQPAPAMIAMKVVKMNVLVPQSAPASASPGAAPIPAVAKAPAGQTVYWFPSGQYGAPAVANYGWNGNPQALSTAPTPPAYPTAPIAPAYPALPVPALPAPAHPVLPAPALSGPASVPIVTPVVAPPANR